MFISKYVHKCNIKNKQFEIYCQNEATINILFFYYLSFKAVISTAVPQEFLKHAAPDYLVRGTDLFSLRLSNKKNDNSQHNSRLV